MSQIQVLTLDFWNTLYEHIGTAEYRETVRNEALEQVCRGKVSCESYEWIHQCFPLIDRFVKSRWKQSLPSKRSDIILRLCEARPELTQQLAADLLSTLDSLYTSALKPVLIDGAKEFLERTFAVYRLFVVSDTFFLFGDVLRRVMDADGILCHFEELFFSDEVGIQKPDTTAFRSILLKTKCSPSELVHIGDDIETDYRGATSVGSWFIYLNRGGPDCPDNKQVLGVANSFYEIAAILEAHERNGRS